MKNNGKFDVIVPSSSGKDSSVMSQQYKYNMNHRNLGTKYLYRNWLKNFQGLLRTIKHFGDTKWNNT